MTQVIAAGQAPGHPSSEIARQQGVENALAMALRYARGNEPDSLQRAAEKAGQALALMRQTASVPVFRGGREL